MKELIWKFIRGDLVPSDFEKWAYSQEDLEQTLGDELSLKVISANFTDDDEVSRIKKDLKDFAVQNFRGKCHCIALPDLAVIPMGEHDEVFSSLQLKIRRENPFWWISAYECEECHQKWLVGSESRIHDNFCLARLDDTTYEEIRIDNVWPTQFDLYENLINLGIEAGETFSFLEPLAESSKLHLYVVDLAKQRPGISVPEIARLVNVDIKTATELSKRAQRVEKLEINFQQS